MSSPTTKPTCLSQPMVKSVLVYRNGDPFFPGHRVVIHEKKVSNFEVFLKEVTGGVKAPFGAVRSIYTPHGGHRVRQLEQLQSGEHYVAGGREAFKKLNYLDIGEAKKKPAEVNNEQQPSVVLSTDQFLTWISGTSSAVFNEVQLQLLHLTVEDVKPVTHSRINVSARFRKPLQEPCTIFLIANGDLINPAVRLFIPRKTLNQWDHVLEMVTEKVTLRSGAVHRLYTLDGKLVQSGSDLENGQFYVAVGRDKFKKLPYGDLLFSKSTIRRPQGSKASSLPPVVGSRKSKGSGNDRQSKSTVGSHDTGDMVSSPQPPKRKEKREQTQEKISFSNKPTKVKQNIRATTYILQDNDEGIYKAGEKRSETWGAAEIQEDEDTQRPAETVDEEENEEEGNDGDMNGDQGEEMGEAANGNVLHNEIEENEEKINENYEEEQEEENLGQLEEEGPFRLNGETNEENGEEMEQFNDHNDLHPEEETKAPEDFDNQSQIDSHLEKASNPRVTITSPQESEKNDQTNEYAAVA
ncbi:doublecortin domain-containing protein 2 isoform X2 [Mauremys mutica]|uniref:doublecortin domain-containing protein 2 isoform X2 n=1 Tax=Mauremys mutica TaxID=74926 RepID=UPI001D16BD45|nr:doublecortin domain-containing protein 2 isoform X2 [Mauremys mutica]